MTQEYYKVIASAIKTHLEAGSNPETIALAVQKLSHTIELEDNYFDREQFRKACGLEEFHWVQNLMSRKWVLEKNNTPLGCSVGSDTYWSM
jgi:hypothetical protein